MSPAVKSLIWVTGRHLTAGGGKKTEQKAGGLLSPTMHSFEELSKLWHGMLITENRSQEATKSIPLTSDRGNSMPRAMTVVVFAIPVSVLLDKKPFIYIWLTLAHCCIFQNLMCCEICHVHCIL